MTDKKVPTHTAYTLRRETRTVSRYIEVGAARTDQHGDIHHVYLDRLPVGGFTGKFCVSPVNAKPPAPPGPQRPGKDGKLISLPHSGAIAPLGYGRRPRALQAPSAQDDSFSWASKLARKNALWFLAKGLSVCYSAFSHAAAGCSSAAPH